MATYNVRNRQRGAATIFVAIVLIGLVGAAAFAIDIGYGLVVKSELQNIADTGALAGTRELALVYQQTGTYWGDYALSSGDKARIEGKVNQFAQANAAGGTPITIGSGDFLYGKVNKNTGEIEAAGTGVMAVRVNARRDANSNGVVNTFLAKAIGTNSLSLKAVSASSLSALKSAPAGKLGIPVGISKSWFTAKNSPCGKHDVNGHGIRLFPTGPQQGDTVDSQKSCAGWHTYTETPASAARLRNILDGLKSGTYVSPKTEANVDSFVFTGGTIANAFNNMKQLFNASKSSDGTWTTVIPVYDSATCGNPSGPIKIVGFATAWIYSVAESHGTIDATIDCNVVDWGEGGGDDYGTLVGRPGMVE